MIMSENFFHMCFGKVPNKEIVKANLIGNFSDNKKLKFTINSDQGKKITTLFYIERWKKILKQKKLQTKKS